MAAKEIQMDINLVHPELRKATASFPKLPAGSNFARKLLRLLLPGRNQDSRRIAIHPRRRNDDWCSANG
jgi:hypothetical protein